MDCCDVTESGRLAGNASLMAGVRLLTDAVGVADLRRSQRVPKPAVLAVPGRHVTCYNTANEKGQRERTLAYCMAIWLEVPRRRCWDTVDGLVLVLGIFRRDTPHQPTIG